MWGGSGVRPSKKRFIVPAPKDVKPRADDKLKHVIINEKQNAKASKFVVTSVPHQFKTKYDSTEIYRTNSFSLVGSSTKGASAIRWARSGTALHHSRKTSSRASSPKPVRSSSPSSSPKNTSPALSRSTRTSPSSLRQSLLRCPITVRRWPASVASFRLFFFPPPHFAFVNFTFFFFLTEIS